MNKGFELTKPWVMSYQFELFFVFGNDAVIWIVEVLGSVWQLWIDEELGYVWQLWIAYIFGTG